MSDDAITDAELDYLATSGSFDAYKDKCDRHLAEQRAVMGVAVRWLIPMTLGFSLALALPETWNLIGFAIFGFSAGMAMTMIARSIRESAQAKLCLKDMRRELSRLTALRGRGGWRAS